MIFKVGDKLEHFTSYNFSCIGEHIVSKASTNVWPFKNCSTETNNSFVFIKSLFRLTSSSSGIWNLFVSTRHTSVFPKRIKFVSHILSANE